MQHNLEIQKILLQVQYSSDLAYQLQLLQRAISIADAHLDVVLGFDLRIRLINTEALTPCCKLSFAAFSWILDTYDSNADLFEQADFLFEYKWLFACSFGNTSISKEQISEIGEDFLSRLLSNGYSPRGYYQILGIWYQHLRQFEKANKVIEQMKNTLLDPLGDHPAFELTLEAYNLLKLGQIQKALVVAQDLFNNRFADIHTSFDSYSVFAFEFFISKDSRATEYYELARINQQVYQDTDAITDVRSRILFMYLQYVYKDNSCWDCFEKMCVFSHNAEDFYSYFFLKFATCMLKSEQGVKQFNFPSYLPYYQVSGQYDSQELFQVFYHKASQYAIKFDKRNQNNYMVEELNMLLELK